MSGVIRAGADAVLSLRRAAEIRGPTPPARGDSRGPREAAVSATPSTALRTPPARCRLAIARGVPAGLSGKWLNGRRRHFLQNATSAGSGRTCAGCSPHPQGTDPAHVADPGAPSARRLNTWAITWHLCSTSERGAVHFAARRLMSSPREYGERAVGRGRVAAALRRPPAPRRVVLVKERG